MEKAENSFACIGLFKYLPANRKGREVSHVLACQNTYRLIEMTEKLRVYWLVQVLSDNWKRPISFACIGLSKYLTTNGKGREVSRELACQNTRSVQNIRVLLLKCHFPLSE